MGQQSISEYRWRTAPPSNEEVRQHEFWYRRLWARMEGAVDPQPLVDVYQCIFDINDVGGRAYLSGPAETIPIDSIGEDNAVEWQPIRGPEGEPAATESVELHFEEEFVTNKEAVR